MPIPRTYEELRQALNDAVETTFIEYKRELPDRSKNHDIAIDVTAMSVDGGVLIYGVEEDKATRTFSHFPIDLAGVSERIENVVRDRTGGDVIFHIHMINDPDPANAGKGYVVVVVPESPHAPHVVDGYGTFGRGPTGNRILTQGDLDRLYARRKAFAVTGEERIERARRTSDVQVRPETTEGVLRIVIAPLVSGRTVRSKAGVERGDRILEFSLGARRKLDFVLQPQLRDAFDLSQLARTYPVSTSRGLRLTATGDEPWEMVELEVQDDGTILFAQGGVVFDRDGHLHIADAAVAQQTALVLATAGGIYEAADFHGTVAVALTVEGGPGAMSADWLVPRMIPVATRAHPRLRDDEVYLRQVVADQLVGTYAVAVAGVLVEPILRAVRPSGWTDPLELIS